MTNYYFKEVSEALKYYTRCETAIENSSHEIMHYVRIEHLYGKASIKSDTILSVEMSYIESIWQQMTFSTEAQVKAQKWLEATNAQTNLLEGKGTAQ